MSPSAMSLPHILEPYGTNALHSNLLPCCHIPLLCIMGFDIEIIHQIIQTTHLHASHCHYCDHCNVDFVPFHIVTCYIDSLSSSIHGNTTNLLDIMCTLVATVVILARLECNIIAYLCQDTTSHT